MSATSVEKMACARIPTQDGEFTLSLYRNNTDGKDHLTFVHGEVANREGVLTRVHSECFTGDVLGSLRCDCGPQLHAALRLISEAGCGVLVYLRQEGRGIGLLDKLKAYNLQDRGFDTVDANLELGHVADGRDYNTAALILHDLGVRSVDLVTNNPTKIEGLRSLGIPVRNRVPLKIAAVAENVAYMNTKVSRMNHMLSLQEVLASAPQLLNGSHATNGPVSPLGPPANGQGGHCVSPLGPPAYSLPEGLEAWLEEQPIPEDRPLVTLAFAQSLDGSIAVEPGKPLLISGPESQLLTHRLRCWHDGILVGIGTVLSDDPQLTVRLVPGQSPQPIVLDSRLRFPLNARMLGNQREPWIGTGPGYDPERRQALQDRGVSVIDLPEEPGGGLDLRELLKKLRQSGIRRLMVEGGASILSAFVREQLADTAVVTIAPRWVGGLPGISKPSSELRPLPGLSRAVWRPVGDDMVVWAELHWQS